MEAIKGKRRVYAAELKRRTGYGDTWLRRLEKTGRIKKGRRDPGGKRKWWTEAEADAIVNGKAVA